MTQPAFRILACGGRNFSDADAVDRAFSELVAKHGVIAVSEGGADGFDKLVRFWCRARHIEVTTYAADWKKHGRAAGPIRNQIMLEKSRPELVVAGTGRTGTADMIRRAQRAGIPVLHVSETQPQEMP